MREVFLDNRYTDFYFRIIARRRAKAYWGHTENHHIVPESFFIVRKRKGPAGWIEGDSDNPSNKIDLSAKEHFICHWLLTMMTSGMARKKCLNALRGMKAASKKHNRYNGPITASIYASLKNDIAQMQREAFLGENNPMHRSKGRKRSEDGEARRLAAIIGRVQPDDEKQRQKDAMTGRVRDPFSDEWRANLSKSRVGDKNPMAGKSHREDTVAILREKASQRRYSNETNDKRRNASTGRKEITDGIIYKKVKLDELQSLIDQGWIVKGKPRKKKQIA